MSPTIQILRRAGTAALALWLTAGTVLPAGAATGAGVPPPAQETAPPAERDSPKTLKEAGRDFLRDAGRIWTSPARIGNRDVFALIAVAGGTTFLIAGDEGIRDGLQAYAAKHAWVGDVSPVVTQLGGVGGFAVAGAFFGAGLLFRDEKARDTGYLAGSAILQAMLVDNFLKVLTGRQRPYVADGEDHWGGPAAFFKGSGEDNASFPSGHSAAAFALATVVSMQYGRRAWVPVVAYSLAAGVGLSRMSLDRHWASDVFVGAVVGHLIGRLVVRDHARRRRLTPFAACSPRGFAISLFYDLEPAERGGSR
jgi:membrane-associated phospholipid phosphatase